MSKTGSGEHPVVLEYQATLETVRAACDEKIDESQRRIDDLLRSLMLKPDAIEEGNRDTLPSVPS